MAKQPSKTKSRATKKAATKNNSFRLPRLLPRQIAGIILILVILGGLGWLIYNQTARAISTSNKLQVTATFYPLYNFAAAVGGELAEVYNSTPAGADAHDYEPSPRDLVAAHKSQLFIYHDTTMEPWVGKFLPDYQHTAIGINQHLEEVHHDNDHQHNHDQDPHTWIDPVIAQEIVKTISQGFITADPANANTYRANAANYIAQLQQLDQAFSQGLARCQQRTIVTSHAAFSYLAERYNITVLPMAGLSPEQEPSAAKLAELKSIIQRQKISTVFFEKAANQQLAQTLASETGAQTSILDPIETLSQSAIDQQQNYLSVQRTNLVNLRHALACQ